MNDLILLSLVSGALIIILLLRFGVPLQRNNLLLAGCLFCLLYSIFATWLVTSQVIIKIPQLTRVGNIFGYLVYPMLYLFVRNTFYPGRLWRKTDYLLLLPSIFYIINMMPFFLLSNHEKIALLYGNFVKGKEIFTLKEGWIVSIAFYYTLRALWCFALHIAIGILIFRNWQYDRLNVISLNREVFRFQVTLTLLFLPLSAILLIGSLSGASWWNLSALNLSLSIPMLSVGLLLFFSPGILYGFRPLNFIPYNSASTEFKKKGDQKFPEGLYFAPANHDELELYTVKNLEKYKSRLITFMNEEKPFLQKGLTIHVLSQQCNIPVYVISAVVNNGFNDNFNSWINKYRIEKYISLSNNRNYLNYTTEGLASESGFTNRASFYNAFKREMGITPGDYQKRVIYQNA
ncbi:MAG TPA: AraC family transcriptional regulator [Mucilaginibacter sp.]|jgi:AraC-like DNA-binding protein